MKEEFVNPFLSPAITVWEKELGQPLTLDSAKAVSHRYTTNDITAVIGITGKLKGNVLYEFRKGTAKAVAETMIGEEIERLDELAMSALGELANMISGNAATMLAQSGYQCDISPPMMLEPKGSTLTFTTGSQIQVLFSSPLGPLAIRVGLTES